MSVSYNMYHAKGLDGEVNFGWISRVTGNCQADRGSVQEVGNRLPDWDVACSVLKIFLKGLSGWFVMKLRGARSLCNATMWSRANQVKT